MEEVTQQNLNEIKIGQFRLKGKIKVPNRRIVMDDNALKELKRNVMLFAN